MHRFIELYRKPVKQRMRITGLHLFMFSVYTAILVFTVHVVFKHV